MNAKELQSEPASEPAAGKQKLSRRKRWMFRLLAVALSLVPLLLAELVCIAFDWGNPRTRDDPFVGFSEIHPLFELSRDGSQRVRSESRKRFFADESFSAMKPAGTFRIFCLGGSTVQGRPYSTPTSFPTWLEVALDISDRSKDWEVVNCGGISYASYRLVPILQECLAYEPDLFVICSGHNEFLEDRTYDHIKHPSASTQLTMKILGHSRVFTLLREALGSSEKPSDDPDPPKLPAEVDAMLDYNDSLKLYHRDDEWKSNIVEHYGFNLQRMVDFCREAGVPILFVRPPSNLADTPPFKSEHSRDLSAEDLQRFDELFAAAREHYRDDLDQSCRLLEQAVELDPRYALAWYELGQCRLSMPGDHSLARDAFWRARDEDICSLRMISQLEEKLRDVAERNDVPLLDAFALLEAECRSGILDDEKLVDHVHPSFRGNQEIGLALAEELERLGIVHLAPDWKSNSEAEFRIRFNSLEDFYFHSGLESLRALQGWTQGRAVAPDAGERFPHRLER